MTNKKTEFIQAMVGKYFLLFATVLITIAFGLFNSKFFQISNLLSILSSATLLVILAFSAMVLMSTGEVNFGIGAEATLSAAMLGTILIRTPIRNYWLAVFVVLVIAVGVGLVNAFFSIYIGMPTFVATIAISTVYNGVINTLTSGTTLFSLDWPEAFTFLGGGYVGGIPILALVFIAISVVMWVFWDKTKLGRYIQAVGENAVASKQAGINIMKVRVLAFVITSVLASFCGILACSRTGNVSPTLGSSLLMNAMAVAMLSATFLRPGHFNVQGIVISAILISVLKIGITFLGLGPYWEDIIKGIVLAIAVGYIALHHEKGLPSVRMG